MIIARAVSEQYKEKYDFYNNLKSFLNQFRINLNFRQDKILNFLNQTKAKKQFSNFILAYKKYCKTNEFNLDVIKILSSEEKKQLENMVKNIGKFDQSSETLQIETFLIEIEEKLKKSEDEKNKLCPMILKLSLLFAIGLAILLL